MASIDTELLEDQEDLQYISAAKIKSLESGCEEQKVGAVIVRKHPTQKILSIACNGLSDGMSKCSTEMHDSGKGCACAEENAIAEAARKGESTLGATMYVTHEPCYKSAQAIIAAGIKRVKYGGESGDSSGPLLLLSKGVEVSRYAKGTKLWRTFDLID